MSANAANANAPDADAPVAEAVATIQDVAPPPTQVVIGAPTQAQFTALAMMTDSHHRCWSRLKCDAMLEILKESEKGKARCKKYRSIVTGYTDVNGIDVPPVELWKDWDTTLKKVKLCKANDKGELFIVDRNREKKVLPVEDHLSCFAKCYFLRFGVGTRFEKKNLKAVRFQETMSNEYYFNAKFFFTFLQNTSPPPAVVAQPPTLLQQRSATAQPPSVVTTSELTLYEQPAAVQQSVAVSTQVELAARNGGNALDEAALTRCLVAAVGAAGAVGARINLYMAPSQHQHVQGDFIDNRTHANNNNILHDIHNVVKDTQQHVVSMSSVKKQPGPTRQVAIGEVTSTLFQSTTPDRAGVQTFTETETNANTNGWSPASENNDKVGDEIEDKDNHMDNLVSHLTARGQDPPDSPDLVISGRYVGAEVTSKHEKSDLSDDDFGAEVASEHEKSDWGTEKSDWSFKDDKSNVKESNVSHPPDVEGSDDHPPGTRWSYFSSFWKE